LIGLEASYKRTENFRLLSSLDSLMVFFFIEDYEVKEAYVSSCMNDLETSLNP